MSKNPQEMANMISRALQDNHGYGAEHPFCQQSILTKIVKQAQGFSKNRVIFRKTQLALTEEGAEHIASVIAREDANILRPYNMQHEYFYPVMMKLLVQYGEYPSGNKDWRTHDLEKCWHKIDGVSLPGTKAIRRNGAFSDIRLSQQFFDALGSGNISQYQAVLGDAFWTKPDFQKAITSRDDPPDYTMGAPALPGNFQRPSQRENPENSSPEQPKKSHMKNATTVMGMLGLGTLAAYGLATNDAPEPSGNPNEPPKEKSFWAQPRKYLALAALLGMSIWGAVIYNQSKQGVSR